MQSNHKVIHLIVCGMIWLGTLSFFPASVFSQAESATPRMRQVGVIVAPPAYIKTDDNRWVGFSAELWQAVAQRWAFNSDFGNLAPLSICWMPLKNEKLMSSLLCRHGKLD